MAQSTEKPSQEGLDKFVEERVSKCEYWRQELKKAQEIISRLALDLETAEMEAIEARKQYQLSLLK